METDKIVVDFKVTTDGLTAQLQEINNELKATEEQAKKTGKKTEDAFDSIGKKTESLKTQYRKLKAELANATDPKEIERLARATGKLKDQLDDATDAAKVFASESKFEQMGNALGSMVGKLRNLDFKGASDQAKLLLGVIQSISFKDIVEGVKTFGTTIANVGKALLTNPIFLLAATLTAVGYAIYEVSEAWKDYNTASAAANEYIKESNSELAKQRKNIQLNSIAVKEAAGQLTKLEADRLRQGIENDNKLLKSKEAYVSALLKLSREQNVSLTDLVDGKANENISGRAYLRILELRKFNREKERIDKEYRAVSRVNLAEAKTELALIEAKAAAEQLAAQKKANEDKLREEAKFHKAKKEIGGFEFNTGDAFLDTVKREAQGEFDIKQEFRKITAEEEKAATEESKQRTKDFYEYEAAQAKKAQDEEAKRKKEREDTQREAINLAYQLADVVSEITKRNTEEKIASEEQTSEIAIAELDKRLKNKEINEKQYNALKLEEEKQLAANISAIKSKQFESDRQIALVNVALNTAVQMTKYAGNLPAMALVAAMGVLQAAVIISQPTPKFAKGGVDIKGKGTGTSDEIPALISNGESVITAAATKQHKGLLSAMNKGIADKYIAEYYIAPILKQQIIKVNEEKDKSFARNIANSIILKQKLNDANILESLKTSRRNDKKIAEYLANTIKSSKHNSRSW